MTFFHRRTLFAFVLGAALATAVLVGRAAHATTNTINACFKPSNGTLYLLGEGSGRDECQPGDIPISWNTTGVNGQDGVSVTSQALAPGDDTACPNGGSMFTAVSGVTYACNGSNGEQGQDGDDGASVTNQALAPGDDSACPNGGTKFTSANGISYACNGSNGQDGQDGVDGQDGHDGVDGQDGGDFSGTFTSPNGQFKLAISDSGVLLEKLQQPGQQLRHMIRLTDTSIQIETPGLFSAVTGGTAIGGRTQVTLNSGSALATLNGGNGRITLNGSNCGVLRPADFASDIGPGGGQILLNPLNAGSPTVRFGCQ